MNRRSSIPTHEHASQNAPVSDRRRSVEARPPEEPFGSLRSLDTVDEQELERRLRKRFRQHGHQSSHGHTSSFPLNQTIQLTVTKHHGTVQMQRRASVTVSIREKRAGALVGEEYTEAGSSWRKFGSSSLSALSRFFGSRSANFHLEQEAGAHSTHSTHRSPRTQKKNRKERGRKRSQTADPITAPSPTLFAAPLSPRSPSTATRFPATMQAKSPQTGSNIKQRILAPAVPTISVSTLTRSNLLVESASGSPLITPRWNRVSRHASICTDNPNTVPSAFKPIALQPSRKPSQAIIPAGTPLEPNPGAFPETAPLGYETTLSPSGTSAHSLQHLLASPEQSNLKPKTPNPVHWPIRKPQLLSRKALSTNELDATPGCQTVFFTPNAFPRKSSSSAPKSSNSSLATKLHQWTRKKVQRAQSFSALDEGKQVPAERLLDHHPSATSGSLWSVKETNAIEPRDESQTKAFLSEVKEKLQLDHVEGQINQYVIIKDIAEGSFGKVLLVYDTLSERYFACKAVSKKRLRKKNLWRQGPPRSKNQVVASGVPMATNDGNQECAQPSPKESPSTPMSASVYPTIPVDSSTQNPLISPTSPPSSAPMNMSRKFDYMDLVRREIAILKKISKHPNIATLVEVLDDEKSDNLYMVSELCEYGSIMRLKCNEEVPPLSEDLARRYFRHILLGLEYRNFHGKCFQQTFYFPLYVIVHHLNIIHRDIKPENILLNASNHAVIGDFSISYCDKELGHANSAPSSDGGTSVLTPMFTPPELLAVHKHSNYVDLCKNMNQASADIWPLGITLYCFVHGHVPFSCSSNNDPEVMYRQIQTTPIGTLLKEDLSDALKHLLFRLLDRNPTTRITLQQAKVHPWTTAHGTDPMLSTEENCQPREADATATVGTTTLTVATDSVETRSVDGHDCVSLISDKDLEEAVRPAAVTVLDRLRERMKRNANGTKF